MTIEPNTSPCCHHDAGPSSVEAMERELALERTLLQHWQLLGGGIDAHRGADPRRQSRWRRGHRRLHQPQQHLPLRPGVGHPQLNLRAAAWRSWSFRNSCAAWINPWRVRPTLIYCQQSRGSSPSTAA